MSQSHSPLARDSPESALQRAPRLAVGDRVEVTLFRGRPCGTIVGIVAWKPPGSAFRVRIDGSAGAGPFEGQVRDLVASVLRPLPAAEDNRSCAAVPCEEPEMAPSTGGRKPFARLPRECAVGCLAILNFEDLHAVASCCKAWRGLRASAPFIAARKAVDERALVLNVRIDNAETERCYVLMKNSWRGGVIAEPPFWGTNDWKLLVLQDKLLLFQETISAPCDWSSGGPIHTRVYEHRCYEYDLKHNRWREKLIPSSRSPFFMPTLCVVGTEVVTLLEDSKLMSFRPGNDSWVTEFPTPPKDVCRDDASHPPTLFCAGNKLYVIGGMDSNAYSRRELAGDLQALDLSTKSWKECARMITPRVHVLVAESFNQINARNEIFVMGGESATESSDVVEVYDTEGDVWHVSHPLPGNARLDPWFSCSGSCAATHDGRIVALSDNTKGGAIAASPLSEWNWRPFPCDEREIPTPCQDTGCYYQLASLPLW